MMNYVFVFLLLSIASVLYYNLAIKYNIIDKPNKRSSHTKPTIRGGGIIFYLSVLIFYIVYFQYHYFFLGLSIITLLSFIDDLYTLSPKIRLPFQFISVLLLLYDLNIYNFFPLWFLIVLLIFVVGFINLYNFMDGINGITGLYSSLIVISLYYINWQNGEIIQEKLIIYVIFSILIFGFYNYRKKALMFAGDIGSIGIAFILFFMTLLLSFKLQSPLLLLLFLVYALDAGFSVLLRLLKKDNIFEAHREHLYQILVDKFKFTHLKVSLLFIVIQVFVNIIVLKFYNKNLYTQFIVLGIVLISFSIVYLSLKRYLNNKVSLNK